MCRSLLSRVLLGASLLDSLNTRVSDRNLLCVLAAEDADAPKDEDSKSEDDDDDLDAEDDGEQKGTPPPAEEAVVTLTTANFDKTVKEDKQNPFWLVEFYAPWCGHCKQLAPEYEKAAQTMKSRKRKTKLAKVDATIEGGLAEKFGVKGYPTLFYFNGGSQTDYNGPRDADGIVSWLESREKDPLEICSEKKWEEQVREAVYNIECCKF